MITIFFAKSVCHRLACHIWYYKLIISQLYTLFVSHTYSDFPGNQELLDMICIYFYVPHCLCYAGYIATTYSIHLFYSLLVHACLSSHRLYHVYHKIKKLEIAFIFYSYSALHNCDGCLHFQAKHTLYKFYHFWWQWAFKTNIKR